MFLAEEPDRVRDPMKFVWISDNGVLELDIGPSFCENSSDDEASSEDSSEDPDTTTAAACSAVYNFREAMTRHTEGEPVAVRGTMNATWYE